MVKITGYKTHGKFYPIIFIQFFLSDKLYPEDVRFPTSLTGDGTDAMLVAQCSTERANQYDHFLGILIATTRLLTLSCSPTRT